MFEPILFGHGVLPPSKWWFTTWNFSHGFSGRILLLTAHACQGWLKHQPSPRRCHCSKIAKQKRNAAEEIKQGIIQLLVGGFNHFLLSPLPGEWSNLTNVFLNGLKPPTSTYPYCRWGGTKWMLCWRVRELARIFMPPPQLLFFFGWNTCVQQKWQTKILGGSILKGTDGVQQILSDKLYQQKVCLELWESHSLSIPFQSYTVIHIYIYHQ